METTPARNDAVLPVLLPSSQPTMPMRNPKTTLMRTLPVLPVLVVYLYMKAAR